MFFFTDGALTARMDFAHGGPEVRMSDPAKSRLSFWASAWVLGLFGLLSAVLWPEAWAQVRMAEPGEGSVRGWWADRATLQRRQQFEQALDMLHSESWALEQEEFLKNLEFEETPEVPVLVSAPDLVETIMDKILGERMPTEFEIQEMVAVRNSGTSSVVSMRMDGLDIAVGIPLSTQVSLRGAVLADFIMSTPIFTGNGALVGELYRSLSNVGYSLGFDYATGGGDVVFGRMVVRGNDMTLPGLAPSASAEPLFLGVMMGTVFDTRWQGPSSRTSGSR